MTIKILPVLMLLFIGFISAAQPPRGGGFDPQDMAKREKEVLIKKLDGLTEDQNLLLSGIYDEYGQSFAEIRNEMRQTRNFEGMRAKMTALRSEKDQLIKDVLNADQFAVYEGLMEDGRKQREERMRQRGEQGGPRRNQSTTPADSTSNSGL
ncbi:MAG: hypothetical protein JXQ90_07975 [Cyclobacteriaceae bacterium]